MTTTTFFIIFIPILAILLLAINLILAPHNPYQEKDSAFECGFHSFLGQNRTQFSISFFIFGLLFLLFDLEILLVYPFSVSSYTNDIYGLVIMMVFFVLLTLGFVFELGKNALTIESRQTYNNENLPNRYAFIMNLIANSSCLNGCKRCNTFLGEFVPNFRCCGCLTQHHELNKAGSCNNKEIAYLINRLIKVVFHKNKRFAHLFNSFIYFLAVIQLLLEMCILFKLFSRVVNLLIRILLKLLRLLPNKNISDRLFILRVWNLILRVLNFILRVWNLLLRVWNLLLRVWNLLLQVWNLLLRGLKFILRVLILLLWILLKLLYLLANFIKAHPYLIFILNLLLWLYLNKIFCDSSSAWDRYFSYSSYHNWPVLIFWVGVIVLAFNYWSYIKNFLCKCIYWIYLFILANISLGTVMILGYIVYAFLVLFLTLQHVAIEEFSPEWLGNHYCTMGEVPYKTINHPSQEWKDYIFLASQGDNNSGNTGESSFPTNSAGTVAPSTGESEKKWIPIPGGVRWYDERGYLQVAYYVNPEGRLTVFAPGSEHYVYKPLPPRTWEVVGGQGKNPTYFTTAWHGETLNRENTVNTSNGLIDFCEVKRSVHRWNNVNLWNLEKNSGSCFECKTTISHRHFACDNCFRHVCSSCDVKSNYAATMNFNNRINGR